MLPWEHKLKKILSKLRKVDMAISQGRSMAVRSIG